MCRHRSHICLLLLRFQIVDKLQLQATDKHHRASLAPYTPVAVPHLPPIAAKEEAGNSSMEQQQQHHQQQQQQLLVHQLQQQATATVPLHQQSHMQQQAQLQARLQQQGVVAAAAHVRPLALSSPRQPILEPLPFAASLKPLSKETQGDVGRPKKGARDLQMELAVLKV